jgi:hypothetical protein
LDYYDRFPAMVDSETPESLRSAAELHMNPTGISIATAGPVAALADARTEGTRRL